MKASHFYRLWSYAAREFYFGRISHRRYVTWLNLLHKQSEKNN